MWFLRRGQSKPEVDKTAGWRGYDTAPLYGENAPGTPTPVNATALSLPELHSSWAIDRQSEDSNSPVRGGPSSGSSPQRPRLSSFALQEFGGCCQALCSSPSGSKRGRMSFPSLLNRSVSALGSHSSPSREAIGDANGGPTRDRSQSVALVELQVRLVTGRIESLMVAPEETVVAIKLRIESIEGVDPRLQRLFLQGRELRDSDTVASFLPNGGSLVLMAWPSANHRPMIDEALLQEARKIIARVDASTVAPLLAHDDWSPNSQKEVMTI